MFVNLTPHDIVLNDGTVINSKGVVRISAQYSEFKDGICCQVFGDPVGLPEEKEGVFLIVSALVLGAVKRKDLVAPATGHPECIRNEKGHIVSVPGFVK